MIESCFLLLILYSVTNLFNEFNFSNNLVNREEKRMDKHVFTSKLEMTVPWSDCDPAGISYFPRNFDWYVNSYMKWLAEQDLPYMETFHHQGIGIVCLKAESEYKQMVKPTEVITVHTALSSLTRTRLQFTYKVEKENGELAANGVTNHTFVNEKGKPVNLKKKLPAVWEKLDRIYRSSFTAEGQQE